MIELHQYPSIWGLPSLSPFCIKVETYLRKNEIPYRVVVEKNPGRGPKGRMPFIVDQSTVIADSTFIFQHLGQSGKFTVNKSPMVEAQSLAFQRMVEENLYFVLLYSRWVDPEGWKVLKKEFLPLFPPWIGTPFLHLIRNQLKRQAYEQGLACHSRDEVYEIGERDVEALAHLLGHKPYFLGEERTDLDATLYSFLITILKQPIESPLKASVLNHPNLVNYCLREEMTFFPEFTDQNASWKKVIL